MDYLLGIDLGTTSCKTVLYGIAGNPVASAYAEYPLHMLGQNMVEQDPEDWWKAVCTTVRQILKEAKISSRDIIAVGAERTHI